MPTPTTYRMLGDQMHLFGVLLILYVVRIKGNAAGISLKSQELYLLVFCARYLDIFIFATWYSAFFKVAFISTTAAIIYTVRHIEPARSTYWRNQDHMFKSLFIFPALLLAVLCYAIGSGKAYGSSSSSLLDVQIEPQDMEWKEILWTFSILLEAVAMWPQLDIVRRHRRIMQREVQAAIAMIGAYRFLYIWHWIYRGLHEKYYKHHPLVHAALLVQVLSYSDFWLYQGRRMAHVMLSFLGDFQSPLGTSSGETDSENYRPASLQLTVNGTKMSDVSVIHEEDDDESRSTSSLSFYSDDDPGWQLKNADPPAPSYLELNLQGTSYFRDGHPQDRRK